MTRLFNDSSDFVAEALDGFALVHADRVARVDGGIVRADRLPDGHVAVVVGGGSGHYPAFAGVVGAGFAAGAVCGQIFTSPSAGQAYRVAKASHAGGGVLFSYGNYAGDVLHFGQAQERLRAEGIDTRTVLVTDDIASAPAAEIHKRRGIAGDFVVFKIAGAAAERGWGMDEVERVARVANDRTRTLGVAFEGCTFPGADGPLFTVPAGMMSIGLGIHGEPGIRDVPMTSADDLATQLLDELLADAPTDRGDRAVVIVNGLGTVKYEELFVLYRAVARRLASEGIEIVEPEVGELVTSLDMAGASVTLVWLTPELESLWADPADSPAYRKGAAVVGRGERRTAEHVEEAQSLALGSDVSRAGAAVAVHLLRAAQATIHEHAEELGRIDAIAGDGDHGIGMTRGIDAAVGAAASHQQAGLAAALAAAGDAWSEEAGGTSGALWSAALAVVGRVLDSISDAGGVEAAARAALDRIVELGGAQPGDKTMVDALVPYVEQLEAHVAEGTPLPDALAAAAAAATAAATATAELTPRLGRARPLAEKSVGHPDAGATSLALVMTAIATAVAEGVTP